MKPKTIVGLQALMWIVCAFHICVGVGLNVSDEFVDTAASLYGAEVGEWSPQFLYILRPLGVFMMALGVLAGAAAINPLQHRLTIYAFVGIFIARATQRLFFGEEINELFGIAQGRNLTNMVFFFALAAALVTLDVMSRRSHLHQPSTA